MAHTLNHILNIAGLLTNFLKSLTSLNLQAEYNFHWSLRSWKTLFGAVGRAAISSLSHLPLIPPVWENSCYVLVPSKTFIQVPRRETGWGFRTLRISARVSYGIKGVRAPLRDNLEWMHAFRQSALQRRQASASSQQESRSENTFVHEMHFVVTTFKP